MRKLLAGAFRFIAYLGSRQFQLMLFAAAASVLVFWIPAQVRTVRIDNGGEIYAVRTTEDDPERFLQKYGITVGYGDTLSVTGFGNTMVGEYFRVPITTVSQPKHRLGTAAVKVMLQMLNHQRPESKRLPAELVVRASSGIAPATSALKRL
jgi:hypothetical protein